MLVHYSRTVQQFFCYCKRRKVGEACTRGAASVCGARVVICDDAGHVARVVMDDKEASIQAPWHVCATLKRGGKCLMTRALTCCRLSARGPRGTVLKYEAVACTRRRAHKKQQLISCVERTRDRHNIIAPLISHVICKQRNNEQAQGIGVVAVVHTSHGVRGFIHRRGTVCSRVWKVLITLGT